MNKRKEINDKVEYDVKGKKTPNPYRKAVNAVLIGLIIAILIVFGLTKIKFPEKVYIGTSQEQIEECVGTEENK